MKQRFKPNLVQNSETASVVRNRLRKLSGSEHSFHHRQRARTNSTASEASGSDTMGSPPPPAPFPASTAVPGLAPQASSHSQNTASVLMSPPRVLQEQGQSPAAPVSTVSGGANPASNSRSNSSEDESCYNNNRNRRAHQPSGGGGGRLSRLSSTETQQGAEKISQEPTVFDKRKADHKKKFTQGPPERTKITMFDLIYYNPNGGSRMSTDTSAEPSPSSSARTSRANSVDSRRASVTGGATTVNPTVNPEEKEEEEDEEVEGSMPVPQVKVGPDGQIIVDEATTVIDTTQAKKAQKDLLNSTLVFESSNKATNYGSWGKKRKNVDWSDRETVRFFKALSVFGTDFSMMENVFKRRSRQDLKMKFKKEERTNRPLVDKCLSHGLKFDASFFEEESEKEENEEELDRLEKEEKAKKKEQTKKQQQPRKKRVRKVKSNRGYFMNTSDEESESVDDPGVATPTPRGSLASRGQRDSISSSALGDEDLGHPAKRSRRSTRSASSQEEEQPTGNENSLLKNKTGASTGPSTPSVEVVAGPGESLTGSTAAVFPPGLLAANPSLANAATGSLVVVGGDHGGHNASEQVSSSPSNSNHQLLHVFRIGNAVAGGETNRRPPTIAEEDEEVEEESEKQTPEGTREASDQISFNKPGESEDVKDHEQDSRNS